MENKGSLPSGVCSWAGVPAVITAYTGYRLISICYIASIGSYVQIRRDLFIEYHSKLKQSGFTPSPMAPMALSP